MTPGSEAFSYTGSKYQLGTTENEEKDLTEPSEEKGRFHSLAPWLPSIFIHIAQPSGL